MKSLLETIVLLAILSLIGIGAYQLTDQARKMKAMKGEIAELHRLNEVAIDRIELDENDTARSKLDIIKLRMHNGETSEEITRP